ncbi:MAG: hypothetical protein V2A54_07840 [Bacteroidota bacterium]
MKKSLSFIILAVILITVSCENNPQQLEGKALSCYKKLIHIFSDPDVVLRKEIVGQWNSIETPKGESVVFEKDGRYHGYDGRENFKGSWEIEKKRLILSLGGNYALEIRMDTMFMDENKYLRNSEMLSLKK